MKFEIGHVLFIDIVGYSKLLLDEQTERLRELTEIVLATPQVIKAQNEQLVRLPTGDGMALVFRDSSQEPAQCALEIAQVLGEHPEVLVRMGIHSGPVSEITDVSGRTNIAGAGINTAQRVMGVAKSWLVRNQRSSTIAAATAIVICHEPNPPVMMLYLTSAAEVEKFAVTSFETPRHCKASSRVFRFAKFSS